MINYLKTLHAQIMLAGEMWARENDASISPGAVFAIGIGVIFAAAVLPTALDSFFTANTTGWDAGTIALWTIVPLAVVAVVVFAFMPRMGGRGGRGGA